jgi:hypothetical protein
MMVVVVMVMMVAVMMMHLAVGCESTHADGGKQGSDQGNQGAFHGVSPIGIK